MGEHISIMYMWTFKYGKYVKLGAIMNKDLPP